MSGLILFGFVALVGVTLLVFAWLTTRTPKTPDKELRSHPDYRAMVAFTRKVAYWNDTSPGWSVEDIVPPKLAEEAQKLLVKEKKELQS